MAIRRGRIPRGGAPALIGSLPKCRTASSTNAGDLAKLWDSGRGSRPLLNSLLAFLLDNARKLNLNRLVKRGLQYAPQPVRRAADRIFERAHVRASYELPLVPEQELEQTYREALETLSAKSGATELGDYFEFGVCHGTSLLCMHRALQKLGIAHTRLFGFDSFEGFPETAEYDDDGFWRPGQCKGDYEITHARLTKEGVDWDRTFLITGWFSETLTEKLKLDHQITKASVIMVDCDLYLSSKEALDFCEPLIVDQAIVVCDDWNTGDLAEKGLGEKRAFEEFLREHPDLHAQPIGSYNQNSQVFLVSRGPDPG